MLPPKNKIQVLHQNSVFQFQSTLPKTNSSLHAPEKLCLPGPKRELDFLQSSIFRAKSFTVVSGRVGHCINVILVFVESSCFTPGGRAHHISGNLSSHASPPSINGFMNILVVVGPSPPKKHQKVNQWRWHATKHTCGQKKSCKYISIHDYNGITPLMSKNTPQMIC